MRILRNISKQVILAVFGGFILGLLILIGLRFTLVKDDAVHHHANFGLYIDGIGDEFSNFTFYEEVQSCSADHVDNPKALAHMHDSNNNLIHVHDKPVTWSQFFANLGYGLTNTAITTDKGAFVNGQDGNKLNFILNGQKVDAVANRPIKSEDVLLISYGKEDQAKLDEQYGSIPHDAGEYNNRQDPATCAGSASLSSKERLKRAIDLTR